MATRTVLAILLFLSMLSACAVAAPTHTSVPTAARTATPTNTPSPTNTPVPVMLQGTLFLDANGSGLMDQASFVCPSESAKPPSLAHFFPSSGECTPGKIITVMEPGLAGLFLTALVDGQRITTTTADDGTYRLTLPGGQSEQVVNVSIQDPNASDRALAMRYINQWDSSVVIPAYTVNGVNVPEQRLNHTTVMPIEQGLTARAEIHSQTGLMQGFLTYPFRSIDLENPVIWNGFDVYGVLNTTDGVVSNYAGVTSPGDPYAPATGQLDGHSGLDFASPVGTYAVASMGGLVDNGARADHEVMLFLTNPQLQSCSNYGHLGQTLPHLDGTAVLRGQIIAITGDSGDNNTYSDGPKVAQLHWDIAESPGNNLYFDPFAAIIEPIEGVKFSGSSVSVWTLYNLPVFP